MGVHMCGEWVLCVIRCAVSECCGRSDVLRVGFYGCTHVL